MCVDATFDVTAKSGRSAVGYDSFYVFTLSTIRFEEAGAAVDVDPGKVCATSLADAVRSAQLAPGVAQSLEVVAVEVAVVCPRHLPVVAVFPPMARH